MNEILMILNLVAVGVVLVLIIAMYLRGPRANADALAGIETRLREEMGRLRESQQEHAERLRAGLAEQGRILGMQMTDAVRAFGIEFRENHRLVSQEQQRAIAEFRSSLDASLSQVREDTKTKLDEIRQMVAERLEQTLETRLGESFRTVSEQLDRVYRGLGEMSALASDVGDLKRVLTNVKTRGVFGEVQLQMLLDQVLAPGQYETNVETHPGSGKRVEFAIRLPGAEADRTVWLPIDAKFPLEDYERLIQASESGDIAAVESSRKALEARLRQCAKDVHDKYLDPPHTTSLAILYLPVEGLYAEAVRIPGLLSSVQQTYQTLLAGPSTLAALLAALQMGFRTVAIERRAHEIWTLLAAMKTEFARFGEVFEKVKKKLQEAQNVVEESERRKRAMERKLREVEALPEPESDRVLSESPT